jgi:hypothetical protein
MFVVLSNISSEEQGMPDTQTPQATPDATDERAPRPSTIAAAVEAAYILEAVRR